MKYVYVLTSDYSDFYLEQTLLSITSLRYFMPDAFVTLIVDNITEKNLIGKRAEIHKVINEFKSITIEEHFNNKVRSRFLKTTIRQNIKGDFLYIDGDTIISEDLSSVEKFEFDIATVLDEHICLSEYRILKPLRFREIEAMFKKCNFESNFDFNVYFNSGVFFCRDCKTGHDFFNEWHRLWLHCFKCGISTDQQSLNQANFNINHVIKELDGIWNCQLMHAGAIKYFHGAKIIHYFATHIHEKFFLLANNEYFKTIKERGIVNQKILDMLKTPKTQFSLNTRIMLMDTKLYDYYDSAIFGASRRIYNTKFGIVLEFILRRIKIFIFTPIRKKLFLRKHNVFI